MNKDFHGNEVKRSCETCEFNSGVYCMGYGTRIDNGKETYGMFIADTLEMFSNGCDDYGISMQDYCNL